MQTEFSTLYNAKSWWNNLNSLSKTLICNANKKFLGESRRWQTLSDWEIEQLFKDWGIKQNLKKESL